MSFRFLGRMVVAATLVAASAGVLAATPAGAANTNLTEDCSTPNQGATINNSDTLTISISGSNCGFAILMGFMGPAVGSATLNGSPMTSNAMYGVADGDVIVYTAPASGSGSDVMGFSPSLMSPPNVQISISFPPTTGSMVDNGDGTMTVTFSGPNMFVMFLSAGSSCPTLQNGPTPGAIGSFGPNGPHALGASPALIQVGTSSMQGSALAAGNYQACLYLDPSVGDSAAQSLAVTIGQVAPTTTTTAGGDPVTPAFTG